ncbi:MAG: hypothetical protein SPH83_12875 [Treponema sp.]|nr:hypothetical protein [Spirochaetales bacterium]MDY6191363.1 hypothetical protein [Treponema sp.]
MHSIFPSFTVPEIVATSSSLPSSSFSTILISTEVPSAIPLVSAQISTSSSTRALFIVSPAEFFH